jgi:hypothetical protein
MECLHIFTNTSTPLPQRTSGVVLRSFTKPVSRPIRSHTYIPALALRGLDALPSVQKLNIFYSKLFSENCNTRRVLQFGDWSPFLFVEDAECPPAYIPALARRGLAFFSVARHN